MKHTMKKLLCMALAIMLLVSAVPVFAAAVEVSDNPEGEVVGEVFGEAPAVVFGADEGEGEGDGEGDGDELVETDASVAADYRIYIDGVKTAYHSVSWKGTKTVGELLTKIGTTYVADYEFESVKINGTTAEDGLEAEALPGSDIWYYLTTPEPESCTVSLFYEDDTDDVRTVKVEKNKYLKLTEALVRSKDFNIPAGKSVKEFLNVDTNDLITVNSFVKITEDMTFSFRLREGSTTGAGGNGNTSGSGSSGSTGGGSSGSTGTGSSGSGSGSTGSSSSKLNSNEVWLHIFLNNNIGAPAKNVNITNTIAKDGNVDLNGDIKDVVKQYFTAKDSDGIGYDGIYFATGSFAGDFVYDMNKQTRIKNIDELKQEGYVHLNIMITNAKAKTSSTADSSNPKTGDTIFVPVMVLGLTASALAAAYVFGKKRIAR